MKRFFFVLVMAVTAASGLFTQTGRAQDPFEILGHYKLLPRFSTLHETGGFAGLDRRYRLIGEYDLRRGIGWTAKASFENAEIWGSQIADHPVPAVVIDVDQILNLEGLKGEALPVGAPFDVFKFTGKTADESSVELLAAVIGPWMYIRGGTQPPPGSADFFTYDIHALARSRPFADYNEDGVVDAADFVMLRDSGSLGSAAIGNYEEWAQQFGETVPDMSLMDSAMSAALASFVSTSAVPEPAAMSLAIVGGLLLAGLRRRTGFVAPALP